MQLRLKLSEINACYQNVTNIHKVEATIRLETELKYNFIIFFMKICSVD